MKTKILIASVLLCCGLLLTTGGCKKLKSQLFQAFTTGSISQDIDIPIVGDTNTFTDRGSIIHNFNMDSLIKAESGGTFGLNDISKITVNEAKLVVKNADAGNNFANFEKGRLRFNTNAGGTPTVDIATGLNPDIYSETWIMPSIASVNLKDYLKGTQLNYTLALKARRATSKILNCTLNIKFHVE
jgi:hypothetical protein